MKKQHQEQVGENLYQLSVELVEQIRTIDRSLFPSPSMKWIAAPGSFHDVEAELEKLNKFTEKIHKHPGFVWLVKKSDFNEALKLFEEEIRKIQDSEFEIARMRIRLLHAIAGSGWQLLDDSSWIPRKISKEEKDRAVEIAVELLTFIHDGVGRPDHPVMQRLEDPLVQFIKEMRMKRKRGYQNSAYRQKEIAIRFTLCLRDFGLIKERVVDLLKLAFSIFDFDLGHRTAQNYVREGFKR